MTNSTSQAEPAPLPDAKMQRVDPFPIVRGVVGAIVGGVLGSVLFYFALRRGLYAIVLPGALAGIFCGGFLGRRSVPMGIACGLFSAAITLGLEWKYFPFIKDESLSFFLANLFSKPAYKLVLIALGIGMGGWFGMGRNGVAWLENSRRRSGNDRTQS
jgi:hypothetical protein